MSEVHEARAEGVPRLIPLHRWLMALTLMGFNLADVYLTQAIRRAGGAQVNPIMEPLVGDPALQLVVKTLVALTVCIVLLAVPTASKSFVRGVGLVIVAYVVVMGWNIGVLLASVGPGAA